MVATIVIVRSGLTTLFAVFAALIFVASRGADAMASGCPTLEGSAVVLADFTVQWDAVA